MFESGEYMHFHSLIEKRAGGYVLLPFNDKTDRIFNLTGLESDLAYLEVDSKQHF